MPIRIPEQLPAQNVLLGENVEYPTTNQCGPDPY